VELRNDLHSAQAAMKVGVTTQERRAAPQEPTQESSRSHAHLKNSEVNSPGPCSRS
jgi:hypothetical protein